MQRLEKVYLESADHVVYLKDSFRDLKGNGEFFDVTLASEDAKQMQAHKVILSSCSPIFKGILKANNHPHPVINMAEELKPEPSVTDSIENVFQ